MSALAPGTSFTASIDPGIRGCGVALFYPDKFLCAAGYVQNPCEKGNLVTECVALSNAVDGWLWNVLGGYKNCEIDTLVFEWPRVLSFAHQVASKRKMDVEDLLPLTAVDAAIAKGWPKAKYVTYKPSEWKGNVKKDVMGRRVLAKLADSERPRLQVGPRGGVSHDMLDAVGIGLFHLGRLEPKRVYVGRPLAGGTPGVELEK